MNNADMAKNLLLNKTCIMCESFRELQFFNDSDRQESNWCRKHEQSMDINGTCNNWREYEASVLSQQEIDSLLKVISGQGGNSVSSSIKLSQEDVDALLSSTVLDEDSDHD